MSEKAELPTDPQELRELVDRLEYAAGDPPVLPPVLPPNTPVMVATSIKLPTELYLAVDQEARRLGVGRSTLIRQLVETGLAARKAEGFVPLGEAIQLLAGLAQPRNSAA